MAPLLWTAPPPFQRRHAPVTAAMQLSACILIAPLRGFKRKRYVNFCHRYPLERMEPEPQGPGYSISAKFARYHQYGNNAD